MTEKQRGTRYGPTYGCMCDCGVLCVDVMYTGARTSRSECNRNHCVGFLHCSVKFYLIFSSGTPRFVCFFLQDTTAFRGVVSLLSVANELNQRRNAFRHMARYPHIFFTSSDHNTLHPPPVFRILDFYIFTALFLFLQQYNVFFRRFVGESGILFPKIPLN